MEKAVVYPFTAGTIPFIEYWKQQGIRPRIVSVVMEKREGVVGQDASTLYNHKPMGIPLQIELEGELEKCDTLIVTNVGEEDTAIHAKVKEAIGKALSQKKNVICNRCLSEEERKGFEQLANDRNVDFIYNRNRDMAWKENMMPDEIYTPVAPVVMVGGMYEGLDSADVVLGVKNCIEAKGYHAIAVLKENDILMQDIFGYPRFFKMPGGNECEKVYCFNEYIRRLEEESHPDVIVIQLSDALIRHNNQNCNGFGILPFMITQAVRADYFVFCVPFQKIEMKFYEELSKVFEYRFGFQIDYIHMSNAVLDERELLQSREVSFLYRTLGDVAKEISSEYAGSTIPVGNCLVENGADGLCNHIISRLSAYSTEV